MSVLTQGARALVIGARGGIGAAVERALSARGMEVAGLSRTHDGLDVTDASSVAHHMKGLDGPFSLIFVATGILAPSGSNPEKSLAAIQAEDMAQVFAANAIGPALILQEVPRLLPVQSPSVVAVLTARVGSITDNRSGGWYSYRASKAAANQIVRSAAIEIGRKRKQSCVVALHPGTVDTAFTAAYPNHAKHTAEDAANHLLNVIDTLSPSQTGMFFDWSGQEVPW